MNATPTPQLVAMISAYDSGRWLRRRLDNLFDTNVYKRGQLLIYCANATSPDPGDDAVATAYAGRPNYAYAIIPPCTVYGAWNWIIERTSSVFITNANADDMVSQDCYDILMDSCYRTPADIAHCDWYTVGSEPRGWQEVSGIGGNSHPYEPPEHISCGHFPLWRRTLHDRFGLFDPAMRAIGDADFWYRCWLGGVRAFTYVNAPLAAYQWRAGSNLWHRTPEETRAAEWETMARRTPGKLTF